MAARVLLLNASTGHYNLGLAKAEAWWRSLGATVWRAKPPVPPLDFREDIDLAFISAIFSWHVPVAVHAAKTLRGFGADVEVGGPGFFGVAADVKREHGFAPRLGPDPRFDQHPGTYDATFWSRGCPAKNCTLGYPRDGRPPICLVPEMEGWKFTLYPDAVPAPMILDNNLSALPRAHQEHIVERTLSAGFKRVDANSGFEPRSFRLETAELWRRLPLVAWRFAYDEIAERKYVLRTIELLDGIGVRRRNLHIYCIAGNEPIEACEQRVREIRSWKALPIVQKLTPLDWTGGPLPTRFDWTERKLTDFKRWGNYLSHSIPFSKYDRRLNHSGVKVRPLPSPGDGQ